MYAINNINCCKLSQNSHISFKAFIIDCFMAWVRLKFWHSSLNLARHSGEKILY